MVVWLTHTANCMYIPLQAMLIIVMNLYSMGIATIEAQKAAASSYYHVIMQRIATLPLWLYIVS